MNVQIQLSTDLNSLNCRIHVKTTVCAVQAALVCRYKTGILQELLGLHNHFAEQIEAYFH